MDLKALWCRLVDDHGRLGWLNRSYSYIIEKGVFHKWDGIITFNIDFLLYSLRSISHLLFLKLLHNPTLDFVLIKTHAIFTLSVYFFFEPAFSSKVLLEKPDAVLLHISRLSKTIITIIIEQTLNVSSLLFRGFCLSLKLWWLRHSTVGEFWFRFPTRSHYYL